MNLKPALHKLAGAIALGMLAMSAAYASPTYVGYPAPGEPSGDFASNGVNFNSSYSTARVGTYDQFTTPSAYGQLFFGVPTTQSVGVSMNAGNSNSGSEWMSVSVGSMSGNFLQM